MLIHDLLAILPEIFLCCATILLLMYGAFFSTSERYGYPPLASNIGWLGLLTVLITLLLTVSHPFPNFAVCCFHGSLIFDHFTMMNSTLVLASSACVILMSLEYLKQETFNSFEFVILMLLSLCSMLLMISAYDLIAMYLAIEFQSLCFYVLAASKRNSEFSTEAGLKYFILGAFSSGILLLGCSLIYGFTGTTNFEDLAKITLLDIPEKGIFLAILLIAVGFLFKITAVPFHMWAPDVYEGSPTFVMAFFSIAPKVAILANMLRLFVSSIYDPTWQQIFFVCSLASMLFATLAAMSQKKIKRFLAYSSIGHVGYLLIGFSCGTVEGIQSLLIALVIYIVMSINLFAILLSLRQSLKYIADLGALAKTNPVLALTLSMTMFSMAGIPPLAGFCSKFYLFFAALGCGAVLLALVGVLTSVISCFYYIRFVKVMYFETPKRWIVYSPMDQAKAILLGITFFFVLFFFLYPSPLFLITHQAALCLCI